MIKSKGFTLIELLIVIAIIGILASIVFVNLVNSRNQAKDAAIQADLDSMRLGAEQLYESGSNGYDDVCTDSRTKLPYDAAMGNGYNNKGVCQDSPYKWAACVYENIGATNGTSQAWCVDNTGINKHIPTGSCDNIKDSSSPACL